MRKKRRLRKSVRLVIKDSSDSYYYKDPPRYVKVYVAVARW